MRTVPSCLCLVILQFGITAAPAEDRWTPVYSETFDQVPDGASTASDPLAQWEGHSAAGVVFNGRADCGKFLVAQSAWTSFNQGPILNLDLSAVPHDRVRVQLDLLTFGEWRGLQQSTGGPQHRLMFFDSKATPGFSFDTNFSTSKNFLQSWPDRNPSRNAARRGATQIDADSTGRYPDAWSWPLTFEYATMSRSLRFTVLCGAAAGSGRPMPHFGIDNVRVSVRSTAPVIVPQDHGLTGAAQVVAGEPQIEINVPVESQARHSLGIFHPQTGQLIRTLLNAEPAESGLLMSVWDGRDNRGRLQPPGTYEWRTVSTPGLSARYVTTIGINPPGGENPVPKASWVGDHLGAGLLAVDSTGVYIGSPITEGSRMIAKCDPDMTRVLWSRPQFYQGGRLNRIAASGHHVFMVHPTGRLRRLDRESGAVQKEWEVKAGDSSPTDMDARGDNLVLIYPDQDLVRWLSTADGTVLSEVSLDHPNAVAVTQGDARGTCLVAAGRQIFAVSSGMRPEAVATLADQITAIDFDAGRRELWAVLAGSRVVCLNADFRVIHEYGAAPRPLGKYDPARFAGIHDIASDGQGGFFIGEPAQPPRRVAHFAADGSLLGEWYGGMSFYINGTVDPEDPRRLFGIAPEGFINVYELDFATGQWSIEACYQTGRLGDSLFPNSGSFRAVRRNGALFLYHRVIPAVIRLDEERGLAVPVAIAGRVINSGRTFFQFAGSGREGFPKPWVAAAEHHGYRDLKSAPGLYSWADTNGNGEIEPSEFRFYPDAGESLSFHNPGDFQSSGDYLGTAAVNRTEALIHLPVSDWEGPGKTAPRWNWNEAKAVGSIEADSYGYGSPRCVSVAADDSATVAYQAGIMIREHGQFEGGGWPEAAMKGSRILKYDARHRPVFSVGRQSKLSKEASSGALYYPMQSTVGPNNSVVVNDQTKQPAQVWTQDGLYVGGVLDRRAEDGRDDDFYQLHGDDNQGATVITTSDGRTYWLMPYQAHNRLYEITGWNDWVRQSGSVVLKTSGQGGQEPGTGLKARYFNGDSLVLETVEDPVYYERFGAERHAEQIQPHYKVEWSGFIVPPVTDAFHFHSLLGKAEQVAVWIDGRLIYAAGFGEDNVDRPVDLSRARRHAIRIEYINPDDRAELKLLWRSRVIDHSRIPLESLFPE